MKLISLNIWGGHEYEALRSFILDNKDCDIFCFQEVYTFSKPLISRGTRLNIFEDIQTWLPLHQPFFFPIQDNIDEEGATSIPATFGQAFFIKKDIEVKEKGFIFTYRERNSLINDDWAALGAGFQYVKLNTQNGPIAVLSIHGNSRPGDKLDTPERLAQSQKIQEFLNMVSGPKIICGDFNLMPETQSIKILEKDMRNLIKEFEIKDTRGEVNARKYPGAELQKFSDYAFVSPDIKVISFQVPNIPVSDHLPLIIEFT